MELVTGKLRVPAQGQEGSLADIVFSPHGRTIATRGFDNTIRLWEPLSGKELASLEGGDNSPQAGLAYSLDGKTLLGPSSDGGVCVWDVDTRKLRLRLKVGLTGTALTCTLSPDGRLIAVGGDDRAVRLVRAADGVEVDQLLGHQGRVTKVVFSPTGQYLAVGSHQVVERPAGEPLRPAVVRLWDVATGDVVKWEGHTDEVSSLAFSPDGRTLAASAVGDNTLSLYEVISGGKRGEWRVPNKAQQPHRNFIRCAAFSGSGRFMAVGANDQTVYLWDVQSGNTVWHSPAREGTPRGIAFHGDRLLVSGGGSGTALVWDVKALPVLSPRPANDISAPDLEQAWVDLASSDVRRADAAIRCLWGSPKQAVVLLNARLRAADLGEELQRRMNRLIADLSRTAELF